MSSKTVRHPHPWCQEQGRWETTRPFGHRWMGMDTDENRNRSLAYPCLPSSQIVVSCDDCGVLRVLRPLWLPPLWPRLRCSAVSVSSVVKSSADLAAARRGATHPPSPASPTQPASILRIDRRKTCLTYCMLSRDGTVGHLGHPWGIFSCPFLPFSPFFWEKGLAAGNFMLSPDAQASHT